MSNMSTKIEDLPGGPIEDLPITSTENEIDLSKYNDNKTNIQVEVVKKEDKVKASSSLFKQIREELNEENATLLFVLSVFMMTRFNNYITTIPGLGRFVSNEMGLVIVKSFLAVITFIVIKKMVLNKMSL